MNRNVERDQSKSQSLVSRVVEKINPETLACSGLLLTLSSTLVCAQLPCVGLGGIVTGISMIMVAPSLERK